MTTLTLYRNRTTVFNINFTRGGAVVNITDATITLAVKAKYTDSANLATLDNSTNGGITVIDAVTGSARATFDTSDLSAVIAAPQTLYWELRIVMSGGDSWMADWGDANVVVNVA